MIACFLISGGLSLVEFSGFQYAATTHRVTHLETLNTGFTLILPMIVLMAAWVILFLKQGADPLMLTPAAGLLLLPFTGLSGALATASLISAVVGSYLWRCWSETVIYILSIFAALEALALIHWLLLPLISVPFLSVVSAAESNIYYLLSTLAPLPIIVLFFSWLPKLLLNRPTQETKSAQNNHFNKINWVLLAFSLGLAALSGIYPYLGSVNPHGLIVGYDVTYYLEAARQVSSDPSNIFKVMGGERPVVFGIIYLLQRLTGAGELSTLLALPPLLITLLAASSTVLAWEVFRDGDTAALAAFFTACGIFTVESFYGFFLANMVAICFALLSISLLLRGLRSGGYLTLLLANLIGLLAFFSHPFTFYAYIGALVPVCLIYMYLNRTVLGSSKVRWVSLSLFFFAIVVFFSGSAQSGIRTLIALFTSQSSWPFSGYMFLSGRFVSNLLLLSLAAFGVWSLRCNKLPRLYLCALISISGISFLFIDDVYRFRLLINLPLGLAAAYGVTQLLLIIKSRNHRIVFLSLVVISMLTYLLRSLGNLV